MKRSNYYMNTIARIVHRSVTSPYYRQHAGLFLFLFFLLFGTQPSFIDAVQFHYAIIKSILSSGTFFIIAASIWLAYGIKTVHFFYTTIHKDAYLFLQQLKSIPAKLRILYLFRLQTSLFAPVWVYGMVVLLIAFKEQLHINGLLVLLAISTTSLLCTWLYYFILNHGSSSFLNSKNIFRPLPQNLFSFLLRFTFGEQFVALFIVKLISFFCLYSIAKLETGLYEDRILWLVYITALIGHCMIIYKNHHFTETKLSFYRNMPVSFVTILLSLAAVYTVILLPEIWALKGVAFYQHQVTDYIWMVLTGPSLLLLLHCLLYTDDMKMDNFIQLILGIWIVTIFFSLSANRWMLPIIFSVMAIIVFYTSYYNYEKKANVEALE